MIWSNSRWNNARVLNSTLLAFLDWKIENVVVCVPPTLTVESSPEIWEAPRTGFLKCNVGSGQASGQPVEN